MKSVVYRHYGKPSVLRYEDSPVPEIQPGHVLVKVTAASINPVDWKVRKGMLRMVTKPDFPRFYGTDFSGIIEAAPLESSFTPGDAVYGSLSPLKQAGSFAAYCLVPEDAVVLRPAMLDMDELAAIPLAGVTAWLLVHHKDLPVAGKRVLVNGCTGGVGHFAVQIAKAAGAHVTGTCRTEHAETAKAIGVDDVIDYKKEDVLDSGKTFDIIIETTGAMEFLKARKIMTAKSRFMDPNMKIYNRLLALGGKQYFGLLADVSAANIRKLNPLIEAGSLKPVIGKKVSFSQAIAAATALEEGKPLAGKLVVEVHAGSGDAIS